MMILYQTYVEGETFRYDKIVCSYLNCINGKFYDMEVLKKY